MRAFSKFPLFAVFALVFGLLLAGPILADEYDDALADIAAYKATVATESYDLAVTAFGCLPSSDTTLQEAEFNSLTLDIYWMYFAASEAGEDMTPADWDNLNACAAEAYAHLYRWQASYQEKSWSVQALQMAWAFGMFSSYDDFTLMCGSVIYADWNEDAFGYAEDWVAAGWAIIPS